MPADPIEQYQLGLVSITDRAEVELDSLVEALETGVITEADFASRVDVIVEKAALKGAAWASVAAAAVVARFRGTDLPPRGQARQIGTVELAGGFAALAGQIRRVVFATAAEAWEKQVFSPSSGVKYWTRRHEGSDCPVCSGLADGKTLRADTPMFRHAGCRCVQQPAPKPERSQP